MNEVNAVKVPVLHCVGTKSYRGGDEGSILAAHTDPAKLPTLDVPDNGIIGTFAFSETVEPSKRIETLASQGATFGRCKDEAEVGAWFDGKPANPAHTYDDRHGVQWTWTKAEYRYLLALSLFTEGPGEYEREKLDRLVK